MSLTRRSLNLGLLATALSSGSGISFAQASIPALNQLPEDLRPTPNAKGFLPGVVRRDRNQTEFTRTLEDYLAIAASEERVRNGRAAFQTHRSACSGWKRPMAWTLRSSRPFGGLKAPTATGAATFR
jgi:membrane-bound lytic murein transglycosylase B